MSGLKKRMRRKLLLDAARQQRKDTAGHGKLRRPLNTWVWTTKLDLVTAIQGQDASSSLKNNESPDEVTPR